MILRADPTAPAASPAPAERLRAVLERFAPIADDEWAWFAAHLRPHHFRRGEHLLREGSVAKRMYFILRGSTRTYYLADGREVTRNFTFENRFTGSSILAGRAAHASVQALEPTDALSYPGDLLPVMYDRHRCWERIGRRIAEMCWLEKEEKELRFRLHTPEEHHRLLVARGALMTRAWSSPWASAPSARGGCRSLRSASANRSRGGPDASKYVQLRPTRPPLSPTSPLVPRGSRRPLSQPRGRGGAFPRTMVP